ALEEPKEELKCKLLLALGEAQSRAGNTPKAKELFRQAAELARVLGTPEHLAQAALGFGGRLLTSNTVDKTLVGLLEEALAALGENETPLRAKVSARLAMELYYSGQRERCVALSQQSVAMARRSGDPATLAAALSATRYVLWAP